MADAAETIQQFGLGDERCFGCGYLLQGLLLPRPCPECGLVADPPVQRDEARQWFAARGPFWAWRRQRTPPALWYSLTDAESTHRARRLRFRWLWLPALLCAVTVFVGAFVSIDYDVKVWYYTIGDPLRTPVRIVKERDVDRVFGFNLQLFRGGMFFQQPPTWTCVVERKRTASYFATPDYFEGMFLVWGGVPLLAVLFGFAQSEGLLTLFARRFWSRGRDAKVSISVRNAHGLAALSLGPALWLWFSTTLLFGVLRTAGVRNEDFCESPWTPDFYWVLLAAAGWWIVMAPVAYVRIVRADRASILFKHKRTWMLALSLLTVGGPVVAMWFVIRLI